MKLTAIAIVFMLMAAEGLATDVITLKNGKTLTGEVTEYEEGILSIRTADGKVTKGKISAVQRIQFNKSAGGGQTSSAPPRKETSAPAPVSSTVNFLTIRKNMEGMTDLQFKRYADGLKGKKVIWTGWVEEVKERFLGGYDCWVDMDSPGAMMSVQDVTFDVSESVAMKLKKDNKIRFTGTIKSVMSVMGSCQVNLEKGTKVH
jgi:hypothetical protein